MVKIKTAVGFILGSLIFGIAFFLNVKFLDKGSAKVNVESFQLTKIIQESGLNLPNGTKVVHFDEPARFIDPVWIAKVIIPKGSFEIIKAVVEEKRRDSSADSDSLTNLTDWWQPNKIIFEKEYLTDEQRYIHFIASNDNDGIALYMECVVF